MEQVIKGKKAAKAAPVVIEMDEAGKAHIAKMVDAVVTEALARDNAQTIIEGASTETWNTLRNETLNTLKNDKSEGKAYTLAVLTQFAKETTEAKLPRGKQYASNLKRAAKLAALGVELPAELATCGRSAWNEHEVWATNKILTPSGSSAKDTKEKQEARDALAKKVEGMGGTVGEAVVIVLEDFRTLQEELASIPVGTFRDEAVREALAAIGRVKAKYRQATGSGNH